MDASGREVMENTQLGPYLLKVACYRFSLTSSTLKGPSGEALIWNYNPRQFLAEGKKNRPGDVCFCA